jgi:hypothetical protein
MITALLQGGMSNQMFQIAAITSLAIDNNDEAIFDFSRCYTPLQGYPSSKYADSIFSKVPRGEVKPFSVQCPAEFPYTPLIYIRDAAYSGYFQSEKYFQHNSKAIKELFDIKPLFYSSNYTTLHVRRGDYLKNPHIHPTCTVEYYEKALSMVRGEVFVFSDDIWWAKDNLKNKRLHFVEDKDEIESFRLMAGATNSIISNSSFSWWAAWLRVNNGITIAPKVWFGPDGPNYSDVVPENWIKI